MPLRANLSVLENIALVPQYRENLDFDRAAERAWQLLLETGQGECAHRRDPDLTSEQRFVALLLRTLIAEPPIIVIERPALLLPDTCHPRFLERLLDTLAPRINECWILDYTWNAPLYAPQPSTT